MVFTEWGVGDGLQVLPGKSVNAGGRSPCVPYSRRNLTTRPPEHVLRLGEEREGRGQGVEGWKEGGGGKVGWVGGGVYRMEGGGWGLQVLPGKSVNAGGRSPCVPHSRRNLTTRPPEHVLRLGEEREGGGTRGWGGGGGWKEGGGGK